MWEKRFSPPGSLWLYDGVGPEFHVQPDHLPPNQKSGVNRLLTAALAALLLALAAVTGSSPSFGSSSVLQLMAGGSGRPVGVVVGDGEGGLTWARSANCTKPIRPQPLAFGGSAPESAPEAALPPSSRFDGPDGAPALGLDIADQHAAASGQSTCRISTGPPALVSRAL